MQCYVEILFYGVCFGVIDNGGMIVYSGPFVSVNASDYGHCEQVVKDWARSSLEQEEVKGDKHELQDLLFFLHVPRTGGRTYFHWYFPVDSIILFWNWTLYLSIMIITDSVKHF